MNQKIQPHLVKVKSPNDKTIPANHQQWLELLAALQLDGLAYQCAKRFEFYQADDTVLSFKMDKMYIPMATRRQIERIQNALSAFYGRDIYIAIILVHIWDELV